MGGRRAAASEREAPATAPARPAPSAVHPILRLQRSAGNRSVQRLVRTVAVDVDDAGSSGAEAHVPPVQRDLAVQVVPRDDDFSKIGSVEIVGRPTGYWHDTMGDHTTAFAVHVEGVRLLLKGKSIPEAIAAVDWLCVATQSLPGVALVDGIGDHLAAYKAAVAKLEKQRTAAAQHGAGVAELQSYIAAYLHYRELVPGSTIQTKLNSGVFGKGHGEWTRIRLLVLHAMVSGTTDEGAIDVADLAMAVAGLFDTRGPALVAAELDANRANAMAPGLGPVAAAERIDVLWKQHVATIKLTFPTVVAACVERLTDPVWIRAALITQVTREIEYAVERAQRAVAGAETARSNLRLVPRTARKGGRPRYTKALAILRLACDKVDHWIGRAWQHAQARHVLEGRSGALEHPVPKTVIEAAADLRVTLAGRGGESDTAAASTSSIVAPTTPSDTARGDEKEKEVPKRPHQGRGSRAKKPKVIFDPSDTTTTTTTSAPPPTMRADETSPYERLLALVPIRATFNVQMTLDAGGCIKRVITGGRPASPFRGTMGAHTTAWIVHLDRVQTELVGRTVDQAIQVVTQQLDHATEMLKTLAGLTVMDVSGPLGDACDDAYVDRNESSSAAGSLLFLQRYVADVLSFVNLIPWVTVNATDTSGAGEGTPATALRNFGAAPMAPNDVIAAIQQLFDYDDQSDDERYAILWANHLDLISRAYPMAWSSLNGATVPPPSAADQDYEPVDL